MKTHSQKISRAQERRVAAQVGGREQFGSGSMSFAKGDVRVTNQLRIECKVTEADVFVLKKEVLDKIVREAQQSLEVPVLQLDFRRGSDVHSFAITLEKPPHGYLDSPAQTHETKSVRLWLEDLRLMGFGEGRYLAFQEKTGDKRWYRIEVWQSFLDRQNLSP